MTTTMLEPDFATGLSERDLRAQDLSVQEQNASDYKALAAQVKELGLLERRPFYYITRGLILLALFAGAFAALFALGSSPWVLTLAPVFGILFTQTAFLAHDGAHKQIFTSGKHNEWVSRIIGNLVVGLSYGWWQNKHTRHHANPNKMGKDLDIDSGALVFTAQDAAERHGRAAWWMARQHLFFFPLLAVAGLDLHIRAAQAVLGKEDIKARGWEAAFLAIRLIGFPLLVVLAAGPWMGLAFMAIQIAVFGIYMGGSFAPNHKGMPIVPENMTIDFLRRQTLMSRNITGGPLVWIGMGGLNFQIEHHLFPNMPSGNLYKVRPIVKAYCEELGISYTETTLIGSYRIVLNYLKRVGLKHADPFECPVTAQFRSR